MYKLASEKVHVIGAQARLFKAVADRLDEADPTVDTKLELELLQLRGLPPIPTLWTILTLAALCPFMTAPLVQTIALSAPSPLMFLYCQMLRIAAFRLSRLLYSRLLHCDACLSTVRSARLLHSLGWGRDG